MPQFNNLLQDMTPGKALKLSLLGVGALLVLTIAIKLIGYGFFGGMPMNAWIPTGISAMPVNAPGYAGGMGGGTAYGGDPAYDSDYMYAKEESATYALSARNAASMPYPPQGASGNMAEAFEVTNYSATIETRKLDETCGAFEELKKREDVIFENSNSYDRGCNYSFKVEKDSVEEVLAWLEDLDPKAISDNTYTIERQVDDFTSEEEVLRTKLSSIESTLSSALRAYDGITTLATNTQNADALAKIIDSRIGIIERLTQEKININEQLDRLARVKEDALDQLEYSFFNVNVYENKYIDGENLKDSWKNSIRNTIHEVNMILQQATLGLIALAFLIAQWLLYALIALVVIKYAWKVGKWIWMK